MAHADVACLTVLNISKLVQVAHAETASVMCWYVDVHSHVLEKRIILQYETKTNFTFNNSFVLGHKFQNANCCQPCL